MSKFLLDTHAFLWFVTGDKRLSRQARQQMSDSSAQLYISVATVWEIAIKVSLERLTLPSPIETYIAEKLENGFYLLPIEWQHAATVSNLPMHHRDPFDRLLIAQSMHERMPLISGDSALRKYSAKIIW